MDMEVKIELGHRALKNIKPTSEGYTHDWTVFVQGANGNEIKYIVQQVIFHLPDSYLYPKRIKEKPPFSISESTSQNISIEIEIHFCKEAKLKKVNYIYDISINDDEVNALWTRKLTFPNPSKEFKEKLLLAGGELVDGTAPPVSTGALVKCKVEPVDDVDDLALNTFTQDINSLHSTTNTSSQDTDNLQYSNVQNEEPSSFDKLLEENETLKNANMELKDKIDLQEKLIVSYEEQVSHYETNISNANMDLNQLKKKIEADNREISILRLQVQMLKNKLLRMKNYPPESPEEKNKEDLNVSAAVVKEEENITQSMEITPSTFCRSQDSPLFENTFDSVKNQNVAKHVESKSIPSVVQESSHNRATFELNKLCNTLQETYPHSQSKNETQPFNGNPFNSLNTCAVEKSIEDNSIDANASRNKSYIINIDAEYFVYESSVKSNSAQNTSEIKIMKAENSEERNTVNSSSSLNKFDEENEDVQKAILESLMGYLNRPEMITDDTEKSVEGIAIKSKASLAIKSKASLNEFNIRSNDAKEIVKGNSLNASEIKMQSSNANKTQEELTIPVQERHVLPFKGMSTESYNSNCKENGQKLSDCDNMATSTVTLSYILPTIKKKRKKTKKERMLERKSFVTPISVKVLHADPCSANEMKQQFEAPGQEQQISSNKIENIGSSNTNYKENNLKLPDSGNNACFRFKSDGQLRYERKRKQLLKRLRYLKRQLQNQLNYPESDQQVSLKKRENIESSYAKVLKQLNCQTPPISMRAAINTLKPEKREKVKTLRSSRNVFQSENLHIDNKSHQDINITPHPKLIVFLTEHCVKLATEFCRIKNSEFSIYREGTNPLFHMLGNIDTVPISNECLAQYVNSLMDYFSDPKKLDMPSLIFLIVDYLYRNRVEHESLFTYLQNQDLYVYLPYSESCIVRAVVEIENKSLPHLNGLRNKVLYIIHKVIISKKKMPLSGLASLCRVFMEMCKCYNDKWEALFLCCELLRVEHPLAPYLISTLAAVWRDPFSLHNSFSVEQNMLLRSIFYGMEEKPPLMDSDLWTRTLQLRSAYFPVLMVTDPHGAIQFLTSEIVSRCNKGLFKDIWMLTNSLVIFVSRETWDWKMHFRYDYMLPNLLHFSKCFNKRGFNLFCNLHVDIFSLCNVSPYEELLQFFTNPALHLGRKSLQDSAAVALLKYIGITDKHDPALLRDWFLRNQNNPKLACLFDLYCKKVMESHDSLLLWDDIIIL